MRRSNRGNLSGQTFGRNHVIERSHRTAQRHWLYRCRDIYDGTEHLVHDSDLIPLERSLFQDAKSRAKKNGRLFAITEADIVIPDVCPILQIKLIPSRGQPWDQSPTLDAIANEQGYEPGNVWVISFLANTLKNAGTVEQHRKIADAVEEKEEFEIFELAKAIQLAMQGQKENG
jgi:hypothetical protein